MVLVAEEKKTTIEVPTALRDRLAALKHHPRQPYAEVIQEALDWLDEDDARLSPAAREAVEESRRQLAGGRFKTLDEVRAELGL